MKAEGDLPGLSRSDVLEVGEEGAAAAVAGGQEADCPYPADGDLRTRWRRHWWLAAFREAGSTPRH